MLVFVQSLISEFVSLLRIDYNKYSRIDGKKEPMSTPKAPQDPEPNKPIPSEVVKKVIQTLQNDEATAIGDSSRLRALGGSPFSTDTGKMRAITGDSSTLKPLNLSGTGDTDRLRATLMKPPAPNASAQEPKPDTLQGAPWLLEQFYEGSIDLDEELARRFASAPMLATLNLRKLSKNNERRLASFSTQDGAAGLLIESDTRSQALHWNFQWGAMLSLRFVHTELSDKDKMRWLELMRRPLGGLAFLWSAQRWNRDYLICVVKRHYTNLYAFSPRGYEAAVRLTPPLTKQLLDWLEQGWQAPPPPAAPTRTDEAPPDLSW